MKLIACYGSLRMGMGNHGLIRHAEKVSSEAVEIPYDMIDLGGFPGLIPSESNNKVAIEVYAVDDSTYRRVESLEGYPSFYDRVDIETTAGRAGIYFLHGDRSNSFVTKDSEQVYDWVKHYTKRMERRGW